MSRAKFGHTLWGLGQVSFFKIKNKNICYVYENGVEIDFLIDGKTLIEVKYNVIDLLKLSSFPSLRAYRR